MVYGPDGKRVGLATLKRVFPNGLRYLNGGGLLAYTGTRNGAPGFWIDGGTKSGLIYAVRTAAAALANVGYSAVVYTTNQPSDAALWRSFTYNAMPSVTYGGRG
jgi:hypothetical protein